MFGLGLPELGIITLVAVLIFGPKKLPELGRSIGQTLRGFKDEMQNSQSEEQPEDQEK